MMKYSALGRKVKELRIRKGWSQEDLQEFSGLSLRTVQRIEKGETQPTGESLRRISGALDVTPQELFGISRDTGLAQSINLSALAFIVFPLLGILVPMFLRILYKERGEIRKIGKELLIFQIAWFLILCLGFLVSSVLLSYQMDSPAKELARSISATLKFNLGFFTLMYVLNALLIAFNSYRIHNQKEVLYFPKFNPLRD